LVRRNASAAQFALFSANSARPSRAFELNERQREAVEHVEGPMLVVAGAGTGKTTVLVQRIARLVREGHARRDEILAITYTENAAAELVERVDAELGSDATGPLPAKTFHAFCYEVLRSCQRQFKVVEPEDLWIYLRRRLPELKLRYYTRAASPAQFLDALLNFFDNCHDELRTAADYERFVEELDCGRHDLPRVTYSADAASISREEVLARCREIAFAFRRVEEMLAADGLGTFGHMILGAMQVLRANPEVLDAARRRARFILIDEFQDSNVAQIELAQLLAGDARNLFAVGDPDQAIYRFRGASSAAFDEFIARFPDTRGVVLERNQRSTSPILACAHAVIAHNPSVNCSLGRGLNFDRKALTSDRELRAAAAGTPMSPACVDLAMVSSVEDEARDVAEAVRRLWRGGTGQPRLAVLYRQHGHRALIVRELASRGIPFKVERLNALETREVRDLMACLRVLPAPPDGGALLRVAALPAFGLDPVAVRDALRASGRRGDLAAVLQGIAGGPAVLSTIENARAEAAAGDWKAQSAAEIAIKRFRLDGAAPPLRAMRDFLARWAGKPITRSGSLQEFLDYMDYFPQAGGVVEFRQPLPPDANPVLLMSAHAAKGLEFDCVFLLRAAGGSFPTNYREKLFTMPRALRDPRCLAADDDAGLHKQEERRLFYVAMTRARDALTIYARTRGKRALPSGFVRELVSLPPPPAGWKARQVEPALQLAASAEPSPAGLGAWLLLPPSDRLAQARLSASAIEDYEVCPLRFKIRRDWVVPGEINGSLKFGTAIHQALRDFYDAALADRPRTLPALLQVFESALADQAFDDQHQLELFTRQGHEQLQRFFELCQERPRPQVLNTEKPFQLNLGGLLVSGRIDRMDRIAADRVAIVDYKTGSPRDENDARNSLQLSIYAIAANALWGVQAERLIFYNLETNEEIVGTRTEKDLADTRRRIQTVAAEIAAGNFEPNPGFHCRSCLYRALCPATEERLYAPVSIVTATAS
jgi:DNA helicase II / ATP-dependent DNA helicase PcrA